MAKPENIAEAQARIANFITEEKQRVLRRKSGSEQFLDYGEFATLCHKVQVEWCSMMERKNAREIEAACNLAQVVIAPDTRTKIKILKLITSGVGGIAGFAAILASVGTSLGWGATALSAATTFFVGTSMVPVTGWATAGVAFLGIALYFACKSDDPYELSNKAEQALRNSVNKAIEEAWNKSE